MSKLRFLTLALLATVAAHPASAQTYKTILLGSNEVPPNTSPATGLGTLVLTGNGRFAQFDISFTGLTQPISVAHAHCCALPGANAGVAIDFLPPNIATGAFTRNYDLDLTSTWGAGFLAANGGTAAGARAAFLTGLEAGGLYINLHSQAFPGGEIRGNLAFVPEPASWAMLISGFGLVGATMRRRRMAVA
jgi:hypothetical protein